MNALYQTDLHTIAVVDLRLHVCPKKLKGLCIKIPKFAINPRKRVAGINQEDIAFSSLERGEQSTLPFISLFSSSGAQ